MNCLFVDVNCDSAEEDNEIDFKKKNCDFG